MINEEQEALDQQAYAAAFEEDMTPAAEPDDFEIPEKPEGDGDGDAAVAIVVEPGDVVDEGMVEGVDSPQGTPEERTDVAPDGEEQDQPADPADVQRAKSWEGRLRAREEQLKAREEQLRAMEAKLLANSGSREATDESSQTDPGKAEDAPMGQASDAVEAVAEAVEEGDDPELRVLAEDFGDDFVKTLSKLIDRKAAQIAGKTVDERVGKVSESVNSLVKNITDEKVREHFESIMEKHPDFEAIAGSPELNAYVASLPAEERDKAQAVIDGGTSRQVIRLLNEYKRSREAKDPVADEKVVAAAEGVRSRGGIKIPEKPAASNDYAAAWDEF